MCCGEEGFGDEAGADDGCAGDGFHAGGDISAHQPRGKGFERDLEFVGDIDERGVRIGEGEEEILLHLGLDGAVEVGLGWNLKIVRAFAGFERVGDVGGIEAVDGTDEALDVGEVMSG